LTKKYKIIFSRENYRITVVCFIVNKDIKRLDIEILAIKLDTKLVNIFIIQVMEMTKFKKYIIKKIKYILKGFL